MTSSLKWRGKSLTSKAKLVQSCILLLTLKFLFSCFSPVATLRITWEKLKNNNDQWCFTSAPGQFKQNFWEGNPSSERILNVPQIVLRCGWINDGRALLGWWAEHREAGGKQWRDGAPVESQPDPWPEGLGAPGSWRKTLQVHVHLAVYKACGRCLRISVLSSPTHSGSKFPQVYFLEAAEDALYPVSWFSSYFGP